MEKEMLQTRPLIRKAKRSLAISLLDFNLPFLVERLKQDSRWAKGELNTMVLLKNSYKKIVLTVLHKGTEIDSFQANGSITFQIIEGNLEFYTQNETVTLNVGHLLKIRENVKYRFTTREETAFLLTIAKGTSQKEQNIILAESN